jgi:hypothetical protein
VEGTNENAETVFSVMRSISKAITQKAVLSGLIDEPYFGSIIQSIKSNTLRNKVLTVRDALELSYVFATNKEKMDCISDKVGSKVDAHIYSMFG